jgi:hypothetical protein
VAWNFFGRGALTGQRSASTKLTVQTGMIKDKLVTQQRVRMQAGRADDGLGPNTDIGARLRALYGAVQDEGVPDQLLDLLEKLDSAEQTQKAKNVSRGGE